MCCSKAKFLAFLCDFRSKFRDLHIKNLKYCIFTTKGIQIWTKIIDLLKQVYKYRFFNSKYTIAKQKGWKVS